MQMLLAENDVVNNEIKIKYDKLITFFFFLFVSSHLLHFDDILCCPCRLLLIKFLYRKI